MERDEYNEALYEISERRRARLNLDLLLRIYSLMGLLVAILAMGYFGVTLLPVVLTIHQQMALVVAGVGFALALMSRTLTVFRKQRKSEDLEQLREYENISLFLDTWARFERISKKALAKANEDLNRHSLRSVISALYDERTINENDLIVLEKALQVRNAIVHGEKPLSAKMAKVAEALTESLVEIIKTIAVHSDLPRDEPRGAVQN